jgi:hypothetical protein
MPDLGVLSDLMQPYIFVRWSLGGMKQRKSPYWVIFSALLLAFDLLLNYSVLCLSSP